MTTACRTGAALAIALAAGFAAPVVADATAAQTVTVQAVTVQAVTAQAVTAQAVTVQAATKTVTITAKSKTKVYGDADPAFTYTTSGLASGDKLTTAPKCSVPSAHSYAGSYAIKCSGAAAAAKYTLKYVSATLTVGKATLTVTPASVLRYTNQPDPAFTYTTAGLRKSADHLTVAPSCGVSGAHAVVGRYVITCTGASAGSNYKVTYGTGTLTVAAPKTVYVGGATVQKFYGAADPSFGYTQSGLPAGIALVTEPTCSVPAAHVDAGTYNIVCSGAVAPAGYTITYVTGGSSVLRVLPVGLVIYADYAQKLYGTDDPAFTYQSIGLHPGDAVQTAPTCTVADPHVGVGDYPILCSGADAGPDYVISYASGAGTILRVLPTPLIVAAYNQATFYGAGDPSFSYAVAGFVGTDTFTTDPTCTAAEPHQHAGSYPITCSGADAGANYSIIYAGATLQVQQAVTSLKAWSYSPYLGVLNATLYAAIPSPYATPLAGATVTFTSGGATLCTAVTDQYGTASCTPDPSAGLTSSSSITASYAGTADIQASSDTVTGQSS